MLTAYQIGTHPINFWLVEGLVQEKSRLLWAAFRCWLVVLRVYDLAAL